MKSFFKLILASLLVTTINLQARSQASFALENLTFLDSSYEYLEEVRIVGLLSFSGAQSYQGVLNIGCQTGQGGGMLTNTIQLNQTVNFPNTGMQDVDTIRIPVTSQYFLDGGGHTVIVWPILTPTPVGGADIDSTEVGIITVSSWLKQTEWGLEKQAHIFPIPAGDYLTLEKPEGKANIRILDIQGRVVTVITSNETQVRIPLTHLPKGSYFLTYSDGTKPPEIHPFIKE